jgi:CRISPR type III-A-associated protein Csm2
MGKSQYQGSGQNRQSSPRQSRVDIMADQYLPPIKKILFFENASSEDIKTGIEVISQLVYNNKKVTTHQIRNIFSIIKTINESDIRGLHIKRPLLAYIGARQKEDDGKIIVKVIDELIKSIDIKDPQDSIEGKIRGLKYIMESIVAYHKFHSNN